MAAETALMPGTMMRSGFIAIAALLAWCVVAWLWPVEALRGWLCAFFLAGGTAIGALLLAAMMQLIPGVWDEELQPSARAVAAFTPLTALLFLPILLGAAWLYPWDGSAGKGAFREAWMTQPFWSVRAIAFLLFASCFALILQNKNAKQGPVIAGLILLVLFLMPVTVDWFLFLDPEAHFSGFGVTVLSSFFLNALCVTIVWALASTTALKRPEILGSLLLAALLAWVYFWFMQYFITWSDNLPFGVNWYKRRGEGAWSLVEVAQVALRLGPLVLLLFGPVRRGLRWLSGLCCVVLAGSALEALWLIVPGEIDERVAVAAAVFAALTFTFGAPSGWPLLRAWSKSA